MKNLSTKSKVKQRNTSNSKVGMGDYYGSGVKQKVGRAISVMTESPTKPKKGKGPKSLA